MYNKLFSKILDSSIWLEEDATRIVWITLLAAMDDDSIAHFSAMENLARRANVSVQRAQKAVEVLQSPDPESGDPEFEGRRIERVAGGWYILNGPKYREMYNRAIQKEQTRLRVQKHRKKACNNNGVTPPLLLDDVHEIESERVQIAWSLKIGWQGIDEKEKAEWAAAYPACDIDRQLRAMEQWCKSNPTKAHKSNWRKFITNWLSKQQDRGGDAKSNGTNKRSTSESSRNVGTANEGRASQYEGVGRV